LPVRDSELRLFSVAGLEVCETSVLREMPVSVRELREVGLRGEALLLSFLTFELSRLPTLLRLLRSASFALDERKSLLILPLRVFTV
jgi:hypothetical protein